MKYPQVVSMPAAVQDWLDEQLEARGIDAIVYTHYILSLLQRDSLDLPDDLLVVSTKEIGRRGRKRSRNREDYWDVWDLDQLKRTAAVECLMSASDQKCGIEKLVDELCIKLKEIQSEGESSYCLELSEAPVSNTTTSLQDQVQKYHAAFPPLNSKFADSCSSLINVPETGSAWSGKKVLMNSFGKNKLCNKIGPSVEKLPVDTTEENKENNNSSWKEENMKSRSQIKERTKGKKEVGYGFAWNMAGERNEMDQTSSSESTRVFHYNRQNQVSNIEMETEWDSSVCRRLYERQAEEVYPCPVKELSTMDNSLGENVDDQNAVQLIAKYGIYSASVEQAQDAPSTQESTDDQNLAQLIAKFDHSIEALWNHEYSSGSSDEFSSDENEQDLPVDFKQLLSSPSEQCLTVELFNLNNKRNPVNSSFIHCGTNITSSIWSDQPSHENSLDQDDYKMDYCHSEHCNPEKLSDCHVDDKFTFVLVGENKIVGNKLNVDDVKKSEDNGYPNFLFRNPREKCSDDKSNCAWNNYDNFSSFFSSLPWTVNNTFGEIMQNSGSRRWPSDSHGSYTPPDNVHNVNTELNDSLNTLNHNREDSSFTEVIPKQNSFGGLLSDYGAKKTELSCGHNCHIETKEHTTVNSAEKEEEDLLTSTKTHFRPIRIESMDSTQSSNSNNVGCYADGTMFVIPTTLEEVAFKRSESGALYLETETEARLKYMEYKEREMYGNRHHCDDRSNSLRENVQEFIPKFRVRQNEKCCQTEELDDMVQSDDEVDTKRSRQTYNEFYFPDDDHFAESSVHDNFKMTARLKHKSDSSSYLRYGESQTDVSARPDTLDDIAPKQTFISSCKCDSGQHSQMWPKSSQAPGSSVWESNENKTQSWYSIWRASPGAVDHVCECRASSQCQKSSQYCQLREELTMEGEQLMSDLSYMQHLYQDEHEDAKSPADDILLYEDTRQFVKEAKSKDDFETSCDNKMAGLSSELEAEWKQIERPFNAKAVQKDRKRRHSGSQRARNCYPHCHDLVDSSCLEGITLRPVTL